MRSPISSSILISCFALFLGGCSFTIASSTNNVEDHDTRPSVLDKPTNFLRTPTHLDDNIDAADEQERDLGGCIESWKGDGECDAVNCNQACNWDDNDCKPEDCLSRYDASAGSNNGGGGRVSNYNNALNKQLCRQNGGKPKWYNDGECDEVNNIPECSYDGNDCQMNYPASDHNAPAPAPVSQYSGSTSEASRHWVELHNSVRNHFHRKYGYDFVNVVWSDELAGSSQDYANVLARGPCQTYDHAPNNPYGENLGMLWPADSSEPESSRRERVVNGWSYSEEIPATSPYLQGAGHFTQVIWRATKYVGCATAPGSEGCHVYVCRYVTPGNCGRGVNTWLADTMQATTRCPPECPPSEGCHWAQKS